MVSVAKKFRLLLWKCYLLRKRNWLLSIFELVCPILVAGSCYYMSKLGGQAKQSESSTGSSEVFLIEDPVSISSTPIFTSHIAYTPTNELVDETMAGFAKNITVKGVTSVKELEMWLENRTIIDERKKTHSVGIVFEETDKKKAFFRYEIRTNYDGMITDQLSDVILPMYELYFYSSFLGVQRRLDEELLKSVGFKYQKENYLMGPLPEQTDLFRFGISMLFLFLVLAYAFLVVSVVRDVIQEKSSGIKELMRIMGISTWMIWAHWFIYTMMVQLPVSIVSTILLGVVDPVVLEVDPFIIWLIFTLFTVNCIFILFTATCLFNSAIRGTTICVCCWFVIHVVMTKYIHSPAQFNYSVQVLLCLLPMTNLAWVFYSMESFRENHLDWDLSHLFHEGYIGSRISPGLSIIIFVLNTLLFALILMFLDAVKPGPYGVAKPLTFFCHWCTNLGRSLKSLNSRPSFLTSMPSLPGSFEVPPGDTKVGIEIRGLRKEYGFFKKVTAVDNVNLNIYEGEIMALLGHNGAGKTTTMGMITGMFSPTKGVILVDGKSIQRELSFFRKSLGLCPQHNLYFPKLTVIEHLMFFGMLKDMTRSQAKSESMKLLDLLKISHKKDSMVAKLSGGMVRRLSLAISLIGDPKVLILDEPTSGLDPETRRHIWNLILGMRGHRTILITTHFMEEADVLGDRIAIMDHGRVICCGTSMFLKKLYGTGYHINILKEPTSQTRDISRLIQQHLGNQISTKIVSKTQVEFTVKEDVLESFPNLFSDLERNKSSLEIVGISVTCTTMEDVFLKVAEEPKELAVEDDALSSPSATANPNTSYEKISGVKLIFQRVKILFWKRILHRFRRYISFAVKALVTCLIIWYMIYASIFDHTSPAGQKPLRLNLKIYPGSTNPVKFDNSTKKIGDVAVNLIRQQGGEAEILGENSTVTQYAKNYAMKNSSKYSSLTLLGLSFVGDNVTVQFQSRMNIHLPAIAFNIMANILLQNFTGDRKGHIEAVNHPFSITRTGVCTQTEIFILLTPLLWLFLFTAVLLILMPDFISFLTEERVSGFKHQQYMAGVSPLLYWTTTFVCDYSVYVFMLFLYFLIMLLFGKGVVLFDSVYTKELILVLSLYGVSSLIFLYLFTFFIDSPIVSNAIFLLVNLALSLVPAFVIYLDFIQNFTVVQIVSFFLSFNPTFAVVISIVQLSRVITDDYICRICGSKYCKTQEESLLFFATSENRQGIWMYVMFLALSWILYLIIIFMIDWGYFREIFLMFSYNKNGSFDPEEEVDKDVQEESKKVAEYKHNDAESVPLIVEKLTKKYFLGPKAVNNVSFLVNNGECFGLLGVNGAGKTTTFKMITGDIIPNGGNAYINDYTVLSNWKKYMSCVGYCPQYDAIIGIYTAVETLKIIANLRGIPPNKVEQEVKNWVEFMGIKEHAHKQSGKYSGGTKRKLSIAMAFIGNPVVVFLDEPTTGVDPVSRRRVWSVVQARQREGQAIVLTSHSMEECDVLCSRLTILRDGEMQCIGTPEYLKSKFNQGYTVLIKLTDPTDFKVDKLKLEFSKVFPRSVVRDEHATLIHYQVIDPKIPLSNIFKDMLQLKNTLKVVEDFTVSNTTLEQLFLSFARKEI